MTTFLDKIRVQQATLDARLADEERQLKEAQARLDREEREHGAESAVQVVAAVERSILNAVDDRLTFCMFPVGRGRITDMTPFEEGFSKALIAHFTKEGLKCEEKKTPIKTAKGDAHDFEIRFSWDHA